MKPQVKKNGENITFFGELRRGLTVLAIAIAIALLLMFTKLPEVILNAISMILDKPKEWAEEGAQKVRTAARQFAGGAVLLFAGVVTLALLYPVSVPLGLVFGGLMIAAGLMSWSKIFGVGDKPEKMNTPELFPQGMLEYTTPKQTKPKTYRV